MWHASKIGDKLQVAHILFYSQVPLIKGMIHHTRSDDRTAVIACWLILMELVAIVPALPSVAVRLLIKKSAPEYGMLDFIRKFSSVVKDTCEYENEQEVIASIKEKVIGPAEAKVRELRQSH